MAVANYLMFNHRRTIDLNWMLCCLAVVLLKRFDDRLEMV